jgi:hypothetical protein
MAISTAPTQTTKEIVLELVLLLNFNVKPTCASLKFGSVMATPIVRMEVTRKIVNLEPVFQLNSDAIQVVVFLSIGNVTLSQTVQEEKTKKVATLPLIPLVNHLISNALEVGSAFRADGSVTRNMIAKTFRMKMDVLKGNALKVNLDVMTVDVLREA